MTEEALNKLMETAEGMQSVKFVKTDKGLIERAESSKVIITEDNRQVLND